MIYSLENELWRELQIEPGINFEASTPVGTEINALILKETEEEKRLDELDRKVSIKAKEKNRKKYRIVEKVLTYDITMFRKKKFEFELIFLAKLILLYLDLAKLPPKKRRIRTIRF